MNYLFNYRIWLLTIFTYMTFYRYFLLSLYLNFTIMIKFIKVSKYSLKKGSSMFFIPFEKREEYYQSLDLSDKGDYKGYISQMLLLIIDQIRSYVHKKEK